jgi:hypothetical protein
VATAERRARREGETLRRAGELETRGESVSLSFSSEAPVMRYGVPEVLLHEPDAIDLTALRSGASVLLNHDPNRIIGRVESPRLDSKARRGRASVIFDSDEPSQAIAEKVRGGSLSGVSVGYRVSTWKLLDRGETWLTPSGRTFEGPADLATRWMPIELSLTPIPLDSGVGIGRSRGEEFRMDDSTTTTTPEESPETRGARIERERVSEITDIGKLWPQYRIISDECIRTGASVEQARKAIMAKLAEDRAPTRFAPSGITFGEESVTKRREACEDHLVLRAAGRIRDTDPSRRERREAAAREVGFLSLLDLARDCCLRAGVRHGELTSPDMIIKRAMSHSTSDYPSILENSISKSLTAHWQEQPATWRPLVRIRAAKDFKSMTTLKFGDNGDFVLTPELVPMSEGSIPESKESYSISSYTKRFGISRQAIVNDDLSAFDQIPELIASAAARVPSKLFWDLLVSASGVGPTMAEDSAALFATTHTSGANYVAGTGAPDVDGMKVALKNMRLQKGLAASGETAPTLNLGPAFVVVPAALEVTARQALTQITPQQVSNVNPFASFGLTLIVEPRLDGATNGTTAWYIVASPSSVAGAEVAFLNGNDAPTLIRVDGTNVLGVEWGAYIDCGVKFVEHRGWHRTRGA